MDFASFAMKTLCLAENFCLSFPLYLIFILFILSTDMAPAGRAAVAPPQMRPPQMMGGPPAGMMQGNYSMFQSNKCTFLA